MPEKYTKTIFRFESRPNMATGYSMRMNVGPSGSEIIYTAPFTKENSQKLFDMRDKENDDVQLIVKDESAAKLFEVKKPHATLQTNFEMFVDSDFSYLFNANYMSMEQKVWNSRIAEKEGIVDKMSDDERIASIKAQEALSQKDKMQSYG